MKYFSSFIILFLFFSCSDEKKDAPKTDTVKAPVSGIVTLDTDSGKLKVNMEGSIKNGEATLFFADGKVKAKGLYINDKPSGAWIRYDENGTVLSAEHLSSNGKLLYVLDKNDFDFRTYTSTGMGISFLMPKKWKEMSSPNDAMLTSFMKEVDDSVAKFKPNINVVKAKLQPGDNLETMATMQIQLLHEQFQRVEVVSEENFVVDSCKAFRRFGIYYDGAEKVGFLNGIIISDGDVYLFSCAAQNNNTEFLKYEGVFQQIVESFRRIR